MIDSIPPSIKQVSGLTFLNVKSCKQLQSLPELPCLLRELRANVCMNLKTVSGSMTTLTQGLDQICDPELVHRNEEHTFCQCLNLDENARSSIMEDAKLRIMRMATAVISKRKEINPELFDNRLRLYPFSVTMSCPGNQIPEWFRYQKEGSSINIKLPLMHPSETNFSDLALCAVIKMTEYFILGTPLECAFNLKSLNGETSQFFLTITEGEKWDTWLNSVHVVVCYKPQLSSLFHNAAEVTLEFRLQESKSPIDAVDRLYQGRLDVIRCGVCILYGEGQDAVKFLGINSGVGESVLE
ncbi:PREDICTED: uncharacterized protein LOC101296709 [Fragaria vesca subsp. vesca]